LNHVSSRSLTLKQLIVRPSSFILIYPFVIAFSSGAGTFHPPSHCGVACILLLSFFCSYCKPVCKDSIGGKWQCNLSLCLESEPQQGLLDFPCATKSKIGTRLRPTGKLITLCAVGGGRHDFKGVARPSDVPRLCCMLTVTVTLTWAYFDHVWSPGRTMPPRRARPSQTAGSGGLGPRTTAGGSASPVTRLR